MTLSDHQAHAWRCFDLCAFIDRHGQGGLQGVGLLTDLPRLSGDACVVKPSQSAQFSWALHVETVQKISESERVWFVPTLVLSVHAKVELQCQRCLAPMPFDCQTSTRFYIFETEAQAEAHPYEDEFEAIVASDQFDLLNLIEDELLLSLPFAPKHDCCPDIHVTLTTGRDGHAAKDEAEVLKDQAEPIASVKGFDVLKNWRH